MKCTNCGKRIDDVDCACKMCTHCGWMLDVEQAAPKETGKDSS